jgi:hypothetical protein
MTRIRFSVVALGFFAWVGLLGCRPSRPADTRPIPQPSALEPSQPVTNVAHGPPATNRVVWNGGGIHGVQGTELVMSSAFEALKLKYAGRITAGRHTNALDSFAALQSLLKEAPAVAPAGLETAYFKGIAGPPSSETTNQLAYRFDTGEVAAAIVIEIEGGRVGKWRVLPGQ